MNLKVAIVIAVPVWIIVIIGFVCWVGYYNSPEQNPQRCITAEGQQWDAKVQTDPQAQMIHNERSARHGPSCSNAMTSWGSSERCPRAPHMRLAGILGPLGSLLR
jgi:hypothetical protein